MNLILGKKESYRWPVKIKYAKDDGEYGEMEFTAIFKRLSQQRLDQIFHAKPGEEISDEALVGEVLEGWARVMNQDGETLPFTPEHVQAVMDIAGVRYATARAFLDSATGGARKNS